MNTNLLDLNGPAFLALYVVILLGAGGAAMYLRWRLYEPPEEPRGAVPELDPYEIAYLTGGSDRVMNTACSTGCASGSGQVCTVRWCCSASGASA